MDRANARSANCCENDASTRPRRNATLATRCATMRMHRRFAAANSARRPTAVCDATRERAACEPLRKRNSAPTAS
eukprot:11209899-Lingulodinium_polyedra.AAC.1